MDKPRACLPAITFAVLFLGTTAFALGAGAATVLVVLGEYMFLRPYLFLFAIPYQ
jgi:hypothetical protein